MDNPFNPGYFKTDELRLMGFKSVGENVSIAKNCTMIGLHNITIGNHVRIDGPTVISAHYDELVIGDYIHIGGFGFIQCAAKITLEDFVNISQGVRIYAGSDDYSGETMTNPMIPSELTSVEKGPVTIGRHTIVGTGSVILPNVTIGEGCAIGALSLVKADLSEWGIYAGAPVKKVKERSKNLLEFERKLKEGRPC